MFKKILIANRGEIACRIIKTAKRLGIKTVAVYSSIDRDSYHVSLADEAFLIGEAPALASYLNMNALIEAAQLSGAEAIHPGYGFLSENAAFAKACENARIVFVGPPVKAIEIMGSKQLAKQCLAETNVPLTPGYHGSDQADKTLWKAAQKIGFPILLKAASGGGGKGMRAVYQENDFQEALAGARREAKASFGDDTMLIEKLLLKPRHIEMQIMADNHGAVVHLFERDCSIQRRHQKIIEEAPAPHLSASLRKQLAEAAITVAQTIQYRGAGTIEFLVAEDQFYFMEMNTRLQVEHPVTEYITGLDLVEWQLRIAANEPLPLSQAAIKAQGHAIECRIYAEDPAQDFIPSIGRIHFLKEPQQTAFLRLDTGITTGSQISQYYDPMLAKLIAWGEDRSQAIQHLQQGLQTYYVEGVKTNIPFLKAVIADQSFQAAKLSTHFLMEHPVSLPPIDYSLAATFAACFDYSQLIAESRQDPLSQATFAWQPHLNTQWSQCYQIQEKVIEVIFHPIDEQTLRIEMDQQQTCWHIQGQGNQLLIRSNQQQIKLDIALLATGMYFYSAQQTVMVQRLDREALQLNHKPSQDQLLAPMPATVVAVLKKKGESIKMGDRLMVLEAMKMEHTILAPQDGILIDIFFEPGAQVHEGVQLAAIEPQ